MKPPSITIVTPCLNARPTIEETLRSVRDQHCAELEHLVMDGGSTDGTLDVLRAAQGVTFVSEPDRGLTHAVNKGIERASGEVIGWVNADDILLPGSLAAVGEAFAADPELMWLTGRCPLIDEHGHEIRRSHTVYRNFWLGHYSYSALLSNNFIAGCSTFVRKRAYDEVGLYDERFKHSMDFDMWLRLGRRWEPKILHRNLAAFRLLPTSLSMRGLSLQWQEHALNAREHGAGHPIAVGVNRATSRAAYWFYRSVNALRR